MDRLSLKDLKRLTKHPSPKSPILRVALIGDTATQFLATAIRGFGVAKGYNIDLFEAEYNQVYQQFMDPDSELYKHDVEFIVLFQSTHKLCEKHSLLSTQEQTTVADERLRFVESVAELPQLQGKKFICMNYPEIDDAVFGSYANKVESSFSFPSQLVHLRHRRTAKQVRPRLHV